MMVFKKTIMTDRGASIALIYEALDFFRSIKNEGYAKDISEFVVRLVLDEALENAMAHGNVYNPGKRVTVCIRAHKRKISILIQDQGCGFDPFREVAPGHKRDNYALHGRGLTLLMNFGSVTWNTRGNRIMIEVLS